LVVKSIDDQTELFLKSFIFALGDDWKGVVELANKFRAYLRECNEGQPDLNPTQAADFLQKNGKTRSALQRRSELKDIDLDNNDRIAFIEYCLLHFKSMILSEFYKRYEITPEEDLSNDAIGVTGVGHKLLDELFTYPVGLDPELEAAIEQFTAQKKEKEKKMTSLRDKAAAGGVKGLAAKNELEQMEASDSTDMNRLEITLNAAKRRAGKNSAEDTLKKKQKAEEEEKLQRTNTGRAKLAAMRAAFQ